MRGEGSGEIRNNSLSTWDHKYHIHVYLHFSLGSFKYITGLIIQLENLHRCKYISEMNNFFQSLNLHQVEGDAAAHYDKL